MRALALPALALSLCACLSAHQKAYAGGVIAKDTVETVHDAYSKEFNKRFDECDPGVNPQSTVENMDDFDACMRVGFTKADHEQIGDFLRAYRLTASQLEAVLLAADAPDSEKLKAYKEVIVSAIELLELIPGAEERISNLKQLLQRLQ